ncbi:MAG: response regulator [Proteobacteria bacterium]|nr:response regulator [Pseudomonadota bacterium]
MSKTGILIVEDEAIIAEDIRISLEDAGYQVRSVFAAGEDALEWMKSNEVDLVLMDIMLAGEIDGIETAARIRSLRDVPVIYLTSYTNEQVLNRAKITSPSGYIIKPFKNRELFATIEMAFYKHRTEKKIWEHHSLKNLNLLIHGIATYQKELNSDLARLLSADRSDLPLGTEIMNLLTQQERLTKKLQEISLPDKRSTNISDLILTIEILKRDYPGMTLKCELEEELIQQIIPGIQLDQILIELLNYVWKEPTPRSVVYVLLKETSVNDEQGSQLTKGRYISLQVSDKGPNYEIPEGEYLSLDDPFSPTEGEHLHSGLTKIKNMLATHNGAIDIENSPEGGRAITIYLKYGP